MKNYFIFCETVEGHKAHINITRIESYVELDDDVVEVTFISGKTMLLKDDLNQDLYEGHCLCTLIDEFCDYTLGEN